MAGHTVTSVSRIEANQPFLIMFNKAETRNRVTEVAMA
jgi:DNA-binding LacI/PurR family transcriptional regulator